MHIGNRRTPLSSRLSTDKCIVQTSTVRRRFPSRAVANKRCRASKKRPVFSARGEGAFLIPHLVDLADLVDSACRPWPMRVARYGARYLARSNCRVFNNDVNERCVSRVRWDWPMVREARCDSTRLDSTQLAGPDPDWPNWRVADPIKVKSDLSHDSFPLSISLLLCQPAC